MTVNKDPANTFTATTTITNGDLNGGSGVTAGSTRGSGTDIASDLNNYLNQDQTEVILNPGVYYISERIDISSSNPTRSSLRSSTPGDPVILEVDSSTTFNSNQHWMYTVGASFNGIEQHWIEDVTIRSADRTAGNGPAWGYFYVGNGSGWMYNCKLEDSDFLADGNDFGLRLGVNNSNGSLHVDGYTATDGAPEGVLGSSDREAMGVNFNSGVDSGEILYENSEVAQWHEHGIYGSDYLGPATIRNTTVRNCTGSSLRFPPNGLDEVQGVDPQYPNLKPGCYSSQVVIDGNLHSSDFDCIPILCWDHDGRFGYDLSVTVRNTSKDTIVAVRIYAETETGTLHDIDIDFGDRSGGSDDYIVALEEPGGPAALDTYDGTTPAPWTLDNITVTETNYSQPGIECHTNRDNTVIKNSCIHKDSGDGILADDCTIDVKGTTSVASGTSFATKNGGTINQTNTSTSGTCPIGLDSGTWSTKWESASDFDNFQTEATYVLHENIADEDAGWITPGYPTNLSDLEYHWPLYEDSGSTANDEVAGANGSYSSIESYANTGPFGWDTITLNGSNNGWVNLGQPSNYDENSAYTWVVWFNPDSIGSDGTIIRDGGAPATMIDMNNGSEMRWFRNSNSKTKSMVAGDTGEWNMAAFVMDGTNFHGEWYNSTNHSSGTSTTTATAGTKSANDMLVGSEDTSGTDMMDGGVGPVLFFSTDLSSATLQSMFDAPKNGKYMTSKQTSSL